MTYKLSRVPLVTIFTSCHNHNQFLPDYFKGLLSQTYRNLQIFIVDDGSTDGSWSTIQSFLSTLKDAFPSVRCSRQENKGYQSTLVDSIGSFTGEIVCFLDSDDYYLPDKIQRNVDFLLSHSGFGVVHSDVEYIEDGKVLPPHNRSHSYRIPIGRVTDDLLTMNFVCNATVACITSLVRQHGELDKIQRKKYISGDYALWLNLSRHTKFGYIPESLARYRHTPGSLSHPIGSLGQYLFEKQVRKIQYDFAKENPVQSSIRERIERDYYQHLLNGFSLELREDYCEGYAWLKQRNVSESLTLKNALKAVALKHPWLHRLLCNLRD